MVVWDREELVNYKEPKRICLKLREYEKGNKNNKEKEQEGVEERERDLTGANANLLAKRELKEEKVGFVIVGTCC